MQVYGIPFAGLLGWAFKKGPFEESYPRISAPFGTMISAYGQEDAVKAQAAKRSWTWTAIRADTIVSICAACTTPRRWKINMVP